MSKFVRVNSKKLVRVAQSTIPPKPTAPVTPPMQGPPAPVAVDYLAKAGLQPGQYTGTADQNERLRQAIDPTANTLYDAYVKHFGGWNQHPNDRINNLTGKRSYATPPPVASKPVVNQGGQTPAAATVPQVPANPLDKALAGYTNAIGYIQKMAGAADTYQMTPVVNNYVQAANDFIVSANKMLPAINAEIAPKIMGMIGKFRTLRAQAINPKIGGGITTWWAAGRMGEQLEGIEQQFRQLESQIQTALIGTSYNQPQLPATPPEPGYVTPVGGGGNYNANKAI